MRKPGRPKRKTESVSISAKTEPEFKAHIQQIADVEDNGNLSVTARKLLEMGLERREQIRFQGGLLADTLLEYFRHLPVRAQYDLLAIADALLKRNPSTAQQQGSPLNTQNNEDANQQLQMRTSSNKN